MKKLFLLGGAGYVGTAVADYFSTQEWTIQIFDNFLYEHQAASHGLLGKKGISFVKENLCTDRGQKVAQKLASESDVVVVLAGMVGDPITKKYPALSNEVNSKALKSFLSSLGQLPLRSDQKIIFISTCSNYGLMPDGQLATETSNLNPLSLYAEAKVEIEQVTMEAFSSCQASATVLRFATAFGISPRMRFDLTVNQFARAIAIGEPLVVFDPDTWRPYCHVTDFAKLIELVSEAPKSVVDGQVFNAGGDANNYTKRGLIDLISKSLDCSKVLFKEHGDDPRNYRVSFEKVKTALGFTPKLPVSDGVEEVINAVRSGFFCTDVENNLFGNYTIDG